MLTNGPTPVSLPNRITIGSAVFAGLTLYITYIQDGTQTEPVDLSVRRSVSLPCPDVCTWNGEMSSDSASTSTFACRSSPGQCQVFTTASTPPSGVNNQPTFLTGEQLDTTSFRCRWQTRATRCLTPTVLYTDVDGQCDKLVTDDIHRFIIMTVHLSWQHLRRSTWQLYLQPF